MDERRQISDAEKQIVLQTKGMICYIDGAPIAESEIEYHHIKAYTLDGETNVDNIAPVCKKHHRQVGTMSLQEARDKNELSVFFEDGQPKYLDHIIKSKKIKYGEHLQYQIEGDSVSLFLDTKSKSYPIYVCPITGWKYFYGMIPVSSLENDADLQPRALRESNLWSLYRHFQKNTQLSPSICRIDEQGRILLFDGQHKAAAQIWSGRKEVECKVYFQPNSKVLKETNLEAHGQFRQMSFYSHELIKKYADIFKEDWESYMLTEGSKSENGFYKYLQNNTSKGYSAIKSEMSRALYNEILNSEDNLLSQFLAEKNRAKNQPLTIVRLEKTVFKEMIVPPPLADEFESDEDFRKEEKRNLVRLLSIVAEEGLIGKWNPELNNNVHEKALRVFSAGAIRAWVILLRDTINQHLRHYSDAARRKFLYRRVEESEFSYFRSFVRKIFSHDIWDTPDPTGEIKAILSKDDLETSTKLFENRGLNVNWVLGNVQ